jgi:hypothetical protein
MENARGRDAPGRGLDRTFEMALFKSFFPMYPLGHNVSDTSSMGMTKGCDLLGTVETLRVHTCEVRMAARNANILGKNYGFATFSNVF